MDLDSSIQLILIIALIILNGLLVASELAILSVNKNKVKTLSEEGNTNALKLEKILQNPQKLLVTISIWTTLIHFAVSITATLGILHNLTEFLKYNEITNAYTIALFVLGFLFVFFIIQFGEVLPKKIATLKTEEIAYSTVGFISVLQAVSSVFISLVNGMSKFILIIAGFKDDSSYEKMSKDEVRLMLEDEKYNEVFNETEQEMIEGIFEFNDKTADKVMTPRTKVYSIDVNTPLSEYLDELINEKYSRVPVYEDDIDRIIGVLYMKDFMVEARRVGFENVDIKNIVHEAYFVPEKKNIDVLFRELQEKKVHMAMLIDEYGGLSGVITIEDLIEEIMGEIEDEYDEEEFDIKKISENVYLVDGSVLIEEMNDELGLDLEEDDEDYDTIGGFLLNLLDSIPKEDDHQVIQYKNILFKIEKVVGKRIETIKVIIQDKSKREHLD